MSRPTRWRDASTASCIPPGTPPAATRRRTLRHKRTRVSHSLRSVRLTSRVWRDRTHQAAVRAPTPAPGPARRPAAQFPRAACACPAQAADWRRSQRTARAASRCRPRRDASDADATAPRRAPARHTAQLQRATLRRAAKGLRQPHHASASVTYEGGDKTDTSPAPALRSAFPTPYASSARGAALRCASACRAAVGSCARANADVLLARAHGARLVAPRFCGVRAKNDASS